MAVSYRSSLKDYVDHIGFNKNPGVIETAQNKSI